MMHRYNQSYHTNSNVSVEKLTVVVPTFNEEAVLEVFHRRLKKILLNLNLKLEVIYVDDGSTDQSSKIISQLRYLDPWVGYLRLSRNFGKETAVTAGLQHATGDAVIIIDADLQDPPEMIPEMIESWKQGADLVNMRRISRFGDGLIKRSTARLFYKIINQLSEVPIPADVGDFRLLSRRAVNALNIMPERNRFMKGLFSWIGFRVVTIDYHRTSRAAGKSKWPFWHLWKLAIEGVTGFSTSPLKISLYLGFMTSLSAFLALTYFVIKTWLIGEPIPGFPTIIVTILLLGGIQLFSIGVLGEYVARIFFESKERPLYLVDVYQPAN